MFRTMALAQARSDGVYFARDPMMLTHDDIDDGLWDTVQAINDTARIWTRFCCEGHWDTEREEYRPPYIQVVAKERDLPLLGAAALDAQRFCLAQHTELEAMWTVRWASENWIAGSVHVLDSDESARETLPAARAVIQEFGRMLVKRCMVR
jgi:hypothetical protein